MLDFFISFSASVLASVSDPVKISIWIVLLFGIYIIYKKLKAGKQKDIENKLMRAIWVKLETVSNDISQLIIKRDRDASDIKILDGILDTQK